MLPTIDWQGDAIIMVDQRKLPGQELYVRCRTAQEVARAIRTMVIRGAPAIGVSAAMGIALGMRRSTAKGTKQFAVEFQKICEMMANTRPTAVNLFWAIDRMKRTFAAGVQAGAVAVRVAPTCAVPAIVGSTVANSSSATAPVGSDTSVRGV